MVAPLHPQPAPTGGALNDHYSTPPQGPSELPQAGAWITAAKPIITTTTTTTTTTTATPTSSGPSTASPPSSSLSSAATEFPLFGQLPPEIRLQIWRAALPPRTVELHSGRYSSHYARSTPAPWHSSSGNPAPLAVCTEARQEALRRYYTVALPVVSPAGLRDFAGKPFNPPGGADPGLLHDDDDNDKDPHRRHHHHYLSRPGSSADPERRLYLDPQRDTLVILGSLEYPRLMALRANIARQDPGGLRRLALTTGGFTRGSAGAELRVWARVLLAGLDQFTLLLHDELWPPEAVGRDGGGGGSSHVAAVVVPCAPDDRSYVAFATSHRQYLGGGSGWIVVGCRNRRMQVARLEFVRADGVRVH